MLAMLGFGAQAVMTGTGPFQNLQVSLLGCNLCGPHRVGAWQCLQGGFLLKGVRVGSLYSCSAPGHAALN